MDRTAAFADLLSYPLRSGVTIAAANRGSGIRMLNMGELFAFPRVGDVEMARVDIGRVDPDRHLLVRGDLMFARRSLTLEGAGKCSIIHEVREETTWESSIIRARLDPTRAVPDYYFYYFRSPQGRLQMGAIVEQVAAAGIRVSELARLRVPNPSKGTQRAIADVLGSLDNKIAANTKLATAADDLALALASRFVPGVALGEVARQSKGLVNPAGLDDELVRHYSLPAYDTGQAPDVVAPNIIKSNKFLVTAPSVLISKLNPRFPRVWNLAQLQPGLSLASTEYVVLTSEYCSSSLLWSLVAQPRFGAQLERMVAGTSGSHQRVKPTEILAVEVPDPRGISAEDGRAIESLTLRAIEGRAESRCLAAIRDALLPALMSGRLTVRDAEVVVEGAVDGGSVEPEALASGTLW